MSRKFLKDTLGWGFLLWLIGYALGILFFTFVPISLIGWVIMPIGISMTLFVLLKKIKSKSLNHYLLIAISWIAIAIICDYFFLVKAFKPEDGYYKLDVYLYYLLTLALPIIIGFNKANATQKETE